MRVRRAVGAGMLIAVLWSAAAQAATPELSVTSRLEDRRAVAAGTRAQVLGFEDGRFYANGWHITGEMGGIWTPPLKLVDGVWFGVDGTWVGPARRFTSGWGYTRYDLPDTAGVRLQRTDFVPDGRRAALLGLELTNRGAARNVRLTVDAHSELMGQYPWTNAGTVPNASDNLPDAGSFDGRNLVFTDAGSLRPGLPAHDYAALVGTAATPDSGAIGDAYWGAQSGRRCGVEGAPTDPPPSRCDDGPVGRGTGGRLEYTIALPAGGTRTVWLAVAGSDAGVAAAREELAAALRDPDAQLAEKIAGRARLGRRSRLSLPGDRLVQESIEWGKQNLADLTQTAEDLRIRWTNQGKQFPEPLGTVPSATWVGAGFPDYPWIFGTDAEYTSFASVALGQFEPIKANLRALRDISEILNPDSGVVVHEAVADGSIWYGKDTSATDPATGDTKYDFNTDESVKFPSTVALIWRWTGDDAFRDDLYEFSVRTLRHVVDELDADGDGWPEGVGNVERSGMGEEKLDNAVYLVRGLYDLADMARARDDDDTLAWARDLARDLERRFDSTWWFAGARQYADSLDDPGGTQSFQKHWIGQTPMDAELKVGSRTVPGLAPHAHGTAALAEREGPCYSGERPFNLGLYHTGCEGGPEGKGEKKVFDLTTSIQAIGEGNYGRLGPGRQQRYTHALAETQFAQPATGGTPDEQPGAMPEIFASPDQNANLDRCWTCRSMFMQAWGHYGTAWAAVHQQLGVRPDLGRGRLEVVPQVPEGQTRVEGSDIRLGDAAADVLATRSGRRYRTVLDTSGVDADRVRIGHTLPRGADVAQVTLDGRRLASHAARLTNRGLEVSVAVGGGRHTLVVTAG